MPKPETRSERIRSAFRELSAGGPVAEDELIGRLAREATPAENNAVFHRGWQKEISEALDDVEDPIAEETLEMTPAGVRSAWRPVAG